MFIVKYVQGGLSQQEMFGKEQDAIERYEGLEADGVFYIDLEEE